MVRAMAVFLEDKLQEKLGDAFEGKVAEKIGEFGGLLTRSAAVRLLCKQQGIEVEIKLSLREAADCQLPFSFEAKIDRIFPVQSFANGAGRSARLHLSDSSGEATLVLWNEQLPLLDGQLSIGDTIACSGAYFRSGEIVLSRGGKLGRAAAYPLTPIGKLSQGVCNVKGEAREVEPDRHYLDRKTGGEKAFSSFQLCEGKECARVVMWSSPDGTQKPENGDCLLLENVSFRAGELHFNASSRLVKKSSAAEKAGIFGGVSFRGSEAVFSIDGKEFPLPAGQALALLGIGAVPQGVRMETMLLIKAQGLAGKMARYRISGESLSWLAV